MSKEELEQEFILRDETKSQEDTNNEEDDDEYSSIYEDQNFRFDDLTAKVQKSIGKYDPKLEHLVVYPGLSLSATCKEKDCLKKVWIRKDYGVMNLGKIKTGNVCSACAKPMPSRAIMNLGYRKAKVIFEGVKVINEQDVPFKFQDIQNSGKFITFKDADENICEWTYLNIDVQKL